MTFELAEDRRVRALDAVLRVVARHPSLLLPEAFRELAAAIEEFVQFGRIAIVVPEGGGKARLYAKSSGGASPIIVPFGVSFDLGSSAARAAWFERGQPYRCDDTRSGTELDRQTAEAGFLSYITLPLPLAGLPEGIPAARMVFTFRELDGAGRAPMTLLTEIAGIVAAHLGRSLRFAHERRLAMILATSGDAMLAWDRAGAVTDANAAAEAMTGRSRRELLGTPIRTLLGPLPENAAMRTDAPAQGLRLEIAATEGRRVPVAATITAVQDDALVACHALLRDLSQVVAAEHEAALRLARIRELEEQHRTLLDNAPLIIFRLDPVTTELVYLNGHAERLLGVEPARALAVPGFLRKAHADPEGVRAFDQAVRAAQRGGDRAPYEARLRREGGEHITARGTVYALLGERGDVAAIEGILADVSAEYEARTRLVQTDRLSTLGMLSAGVAHEINNPAAFILLGLDMLDRLLHGAGVRMDDSAAASVAEVVRELRDSIKRIVDITRDLRLFASPPAPEGGRKVIVDVNRTVESAVTLTRGQILERAQLVRRLDEVPPVSMEDGRLSQVVVNLLVNAAQAIPRGHEREDHTITIATRSDGDVVEIEVTDTGAGIAKEIIGRIWMPFFTTKSAEMGTGLGLSISREIVERAGGSIRVESPVPPPPGAPSGPAQGPTARAGARAS